MKTKYSTLIFTLVIFINLGYAQDNNHNINLDSSAKEIVLDTNYKHDKWGTLPVDLKYEFAAYISSFDSNDPTTTNGENISWGIPEWVAFEIKKGTSLEGCKRPSPWIHDISLYEQMIAPDDETYSVSGTKKLNVVSTDYRYIRGHMAPFATAKRISCDAAWNTCTVINAVPQLQWQNNGIWKELEKMCTDWADNYERIWVVCGPVFFEKEPSVWLGQEGEVKSAIPDALYKIVIREAETDTGLETISFIIPNVLPKDKPLYEFVTDIGQIEELTELTFLNNISTEKQKLEKIKHKIPPLPENYSSLSSSERRKLRNKRKAEFYETNKSLIASWD